MCTATGIFIFIFTLSALAVGVDGHGNEYHTERTFIHPFS